MDSSTEECLDKGIARIFGVSPEQDGVHLDVIRQQAASSLAAYGRLLAELFERESVSVPPAVNLRWWSQGSRVRVVGEHPCREKIERAINSHGKLVELFKELELLYEILHNTELAGRLGTQQQCFNVGITSAGSLAFFTKLEG